MARSKRPWRNGDEKLFTLQQMQTAEMFSPSWWEKVIPAYSFSGFNSDQPLGASGLLPIHPGRAFGWAMVAEGVGRHDMLWIHRQIRAFLDEWQQHRQFQRVECLVQAEWSAAERWAEMLGFEREGRLRCYDPYGRDYLIMARIR